MNNIKIVIAEDDLKISEIQHRFVEKIDGFEVVGIANTIAEAEDLIEVFIPDLVLLDIGFPDGNGIDLLWKIRQTYKQTDVILITAAKDIKLLQDAIRGGVFDFVLKPMSFFRFQKALLDFMGRRKKIDNIVNLEQHDIDQLIRPHSDNASQKKNVPKGIDRLTLNKVQDVIKRLDKKGITAEAMGEHVGVSRTTARRYLEFLVASGVVVPNLEYGSVGRPERTYLPV